MLPAGHHHIPSYGAVYLEHLSCFLKGKKNSFRVFLKFGHLSCFLKGKCSFFALWTKVEYLNLHKSHSCELARVSFYVEVLLLLLVVFTRQLLCWFDLTVSTSYSLRVYSHSTLSLRL